MNNLLSKIKQTGIEYVLFVGTTILSAGFHFIFSVYTKAFVEPLEYGMYSSCLLLQTYMSYLQLGSLNAFNRDYPQLIGTGNTTKAKEYRDSVFSFLLIIYGVSFFVAGAMIVCFGIKLCQDSRIIFGLLLTALLTVVTVFENYGSYRCRIDNGFKYPSLVMLVELLSLPVGIILIRQIGYYGIFLTSILGMIIGLISYFKFSFSDIKIQLNNVLLKKILLSGAPLLINGFIWTIVNSIDKFVILGFINTEALGIYGIAQNAFSYMVLIPSALSQLFYAKMGKKFGANRNVFSLTDISMKYTTVLAAITSFVALVAYFFLPVLVNKFMPKYSGGVRSSQILILGLSIYAATLINGNILTILKKNKSLIISSICMCAFNAICSVLYIKYWGAKIESVALGTATSYIFCAFIIIYQVKKHTEYNLLKIFSASVIPIFVSLVPGIFIYNLISNKLIGFIISIVFVLLFYALFYRKQLLSIRKDIA